MDTVVPAFLCLNEETPDKGNVAMQKIVSQHLHLDMQPFFEWEFKVLPIMINYWFTKATTEEEINELRLSVVFDFIKEFPMLYIEPITRKEIAEFTAMEEQIQEGDKLKEIQKRKARSMRRL